MSFFSRLSNLVSGFSNNMLNRLEEGNPQLKKAQRKQEMNKLNHELQEAAQAPEAADAQLHMENTMITMFVLIFTMQDTATVMLKALRIGNPRTRFPRVGCM